MDSASLLKTRRFLPYFVTQFTGAFNDSLIRRGVEMLIAFKGLSGDIPPETAIFLLLALFMLPFFTFSAWGGFLADTTHKEKLVKVIKIAEVFIVLLAAVGLLGHSLLLSTLAVIGLGVHSSFFGPVKFSLPPQHLKTEELIAANGLIEAGTNIAILFGTILGSLLIVLPGGELYVSLLGFLVAGMGLCASYFIPPAPPALSAKSATRDSTFGLLRRLYQDPTLWRVALGISWFWTLGALLISLFSLVVKDILLAPEYFVSVFFGIFSVGVGLGSILCNRLLKGRIEATWVPLASLVMAASMFAFYWLLHTPLLGTGSSLSFFLSLRGLGISLALFMLSVSAGIFIVPLYGMLQHLTSDAERSRVIAANNVLNAFLMVIGSLALVAASQLGVSIGGVLLALAVLNVLVAVYTALLLPAALLKGILQILFRTFFRANVKGLEHLATAGPRALIVANHLSFLDAVMLAAFLPGRATFAVNTAISKKWWMRPVMVTLDLIAIDPGNPLAVRVLIDRLKQDTHVVIFPEGRISITGSLMKVYEGPALIADKANAPLVPIRLEGFQFTIFSKVKTLFRAQLFPKLSMTVCAPTRLTVSPEARGKKRREQLGAALHDLMTTLIFETNERGPTLLHALRKAGAAVGDKTIIAKDPLGGSVTVRGLLLKSFLLSRALPKSDQNESALGVLLPSGVPALVLFFAAHWASRVPAMLNFSHTAEQLEATCTLSKLTSVITSRRFVAMAKLEERIQRLSSIGVTAIYLEDIGKSISFGDKLFGTILFYARLLRAWISGSDALPGKADDSAVILFTSGSEGTPKGVVLSHANLLANVDQVTSTIPLLPTDRVFNALPMFHSFGLTGATLMPILKGTPVFLYPSPLHYRAIPELVYDEAATILFGTPTFLSGYAKKAHPYDFFSVRYVFSGAERLSDAVRMTYQERFGIRIFEGYGATETAPALAVNSPFHNKRGTVGRLLPGIDRRLESVPGITEGGRLWVKGPNIMKGYLRIENPGVLQPLSDGWYDTGDIVAIDEHGFVSIKGRAKRFAKIGGEMVSLTAIEQALESAWPGSLNAVVSLPDPRKGERLVLMTSFKEASREKVMAELRGRGLPELAIPREIVIRGVLPLLGSGKVDIQAVTRDLLALE
jgi:acyl-[acyl-carrier-protein]-phospholipid O-acyltransferase/long-chain-fatty-acid--[acyl-carrier-protein] ligase